MIVLWVSLPMVIEHYLTKASTKVSTLVAVVMEPEENSKTYIEWTGQQAQESMIHSLKKPCSQDNANHFSWNTHGNQDGGYRQEHIDRLQT